MLMVYSYMKKRLLLFLFALLTAISQIHIVYSQSSVGIGLQIVDTAGPDIDFTRLINNSGFNFGNVTFFYNASDASNISNCTLIINRNYNLSNSSINRSMEINFSLENLPIGKYNASINCTDQFNLSAISPTFTFTVNSMKEFSGATTDITSIDIRNV